MSGSIDDKSRQLSPGEVDEFLTTLKVRFEKNMHRHEGVTWAAVEARLLANTDKIWSLHEMEVTGGEPDVVSYVRDSNEYLFYDCSPESPAGRRNVCYDGAALESRKKLRPDNSALEMAEAMGVEILTVEQYRELQDTGNYDTKTSSWVRTPENIRKLGGALFCDRRYNTVFVYHNGAESYYGARGFRARLSV